MDATLQAPVAQAQDRPPLRALLLPALPPTSRPRRVSPDKGLRATLCGILLAWGLVHGSAAAFAADDVLVEAVRRGSAVQITAHATLKCAYQTIWNTLTDYDHLADFIPGIRSSRVLEWRGNEAIVEQVGEAKFLFFRFPIEVTVGSASLPPDVIQIRVLKGNLKRLDGGYRIETLGEGHHVLHWRGLIEPDALLPPVIGTAVMRSNIEDQFKGMVREIERRESAERLNAMKAKQ